MRTISWKALLLLIIASFFLASCSNHKFTGKDVSELAPITLVREKTPELQTATLGGDLLLGLGGLLTVAAGASINASESERVRNGIIVPDYGKMLAERFASRAQTEVKGMPKIRVVEQPVDDDYKIDHGTLISLRVETLKLKSVMDSLYVKTSISMEDSKGKTLWKKCAFYRSFELDRGKEIEEFRANNGKLLQEEMSYAVDTTVTNYIQHLKGELKNDNLSGGC